MALRFICLFALLAGTALAQNKSRTELNPNVHYPGHSQQNFAGVFRQTFGVLDGDSDEAEAVGQDDTNSECSSELDNSFDNLDLALSQETLTYESEWKNNFDEPTEYSRPSTEQDPSSGGNIKSKILFY